MGTDKALLAYRGRTFLETLVATLREAGIERVAAVLGHHAGEIRRAVSLADVEVIVNREYARGQTSSLQAGLRGIERDDLEAVLLCLVDHPAIAPATVRTLVENFRRSSALVVIPTRQGRRGHPVLLARALFAEFLQLRSDEGANAVVRAHHAETQFVEVDDAGILVDVDNPETYRSLSSGD
jgi:molybdenum cofactor cytidylyltransferase